MRARLTYGISAVGCLFGNSNIAAYSPLCGGVCLQEEELKAAIDKAVEAETRVSEAEIRMKEMKVRKRTLTAWRA
jgi:hypothetical protein